MRSPVHPPLQIASALLVAAVVASIAAPAFAQSPDPAVDVRKLERIDADTDPALQPKPDISTRRDEKGTEFREYKVAGQLQAVKVTPARGAPYWLIQHEGVMRRFDSPERTITVPSWLVLEW